MNVPTLRDMRALNRGVNNEGLTPYERVLLIAFRKSPGVALSKDALHDVLYGENLPKSNCLQTFIARLRRKGHNIVAQRGFGYVFHAPRGAEVSNEEAT